MVDLARSESDLNLIANFKEDFAASLEDFDANYDVLEECNEWHGYVTSPVILSYLYKNGIDTDKPVEIVRNKHRNLRDQVVTCYRFEGQERLDNEWIRSGAATLDAIIASSKDGSMRFALRSMSADVSRERGFE